MPEMHLRQLGCIALVDYLLKKIQKYKKNTKRIQKFKERGDSSKYSSIFLSKPTSKNLLSRWCEFMSFADFHDLPRRTASDKVLCDKTFHIVINRKYDGYQRALASVAKKSL